MRHWERLELENLLVSIEGSIGLDDDPLNSAIQQTNIAHDVVQGLKGIPFQYVQTHGEPGASDSII